MHNAVSEPIKFSNSSIEDVFLGLKKLNIPVLRCCSKILNGASPLSPLYCSTQFFTNSIVSAQ